MGKEQIPEDMMVHCCISSTTLTSRQFMDAIRNHWLIENQFHWRLNVAIGEGDYRIRRDEAAKSLARIKHIAVNILNSLKTSKIGMKHKQKKVTINTDYLPELLLTKGF